MFWPGGCGIPFLVSVASCISYTPPISVPPLSPIKEIIIVLLLQFPAPEIPATAFSFIKQRPKWRVQKSSR